MPSPRDSSSTRVLQALRPHDNPNDFLHLKDHKKLLAMFADRARKGGEMERVLFSDEVVKTNKRGKDQTRHFVLTQHALFNFKPGKYGSKEIRREIATASITRLQVCGSTGDVVLQVRRERPYHLRTCRLPEFIETVLAAVKRKGSSPTLHMVQANEISALVSNLGSAGASGGSGTVLRPVLASPQKAGATDTDTKDRLKLNDDSILEGWLAKRGASSTSRFKRRFFSLRRDVLVYSEAKLATQLSDARVVSVDARVNSLADGSDISIRGIDNFGGSSDTVTPCVIGAASSLHQRTESVLDSESALASFLLFAKQRLCEEQVLLAARIRRYRRLSGPQRQESAQALWREFLRTDAPTPVSLEKSKVQRVQRRIERGDFCADLFSPFYSELMHNVSDLFRRYQPSSCSQREATTDIGFYDAGSAGAMRANCFACGTHEGRLLNCADCGRRYCSAELVISSTLRCFLCQGVDSKQAEHPMLVRSTSRTRPLFVSALSLRELRRWRHAALDPDTPMEGYLKVLQCDAPDAATNPRWEKTYCALQGARFGAFKFDVRNAVPLSRDCHVKVGSTADDIEANGSAAFALIREVEPLEKCRFSLAVPQDRQAPSRVYQLSAPTEWHRRQWVRALTRCIHGEESLTTVPAPTGHVTLVFTDVQSSTSLWEAVPQAMNQAMALHDALLRRTLLQNRGYEVKTEGDAFMVAFGNTSDAIAWCLAAQCALLHADWPAELLQQQAAAQEPRHAALAPFFRGLRVRMGVHCGIPQVRQNPVTGRSDYFGPCVNKCARVSDSAHGGQIVLTDAALASVREDTGDNLATLPLCAPVHVSDLGTHSYKGIAEPVRVFGLNAGQLRHRAPFPALR